MIKIIHCQDHPLFERMAHKKTAAMRSIDNREIEKQYWKHSIIIVIRFTNYS
jgi:hypothetical protein